jgi:outer membrane protein OmpA-like peptidoglycan-associated protein
VLSCVASLVGIPVETHAQGFTLDRLPVPASASDGLALHTPTTLGPWGWSALLSVGYRHAPLVLSERDGDDRTTIAPLVEHSLLTTAHFALGLGEVGEAFAEIPVTLLQSGDQPSVAGYTDPARQASFGDIAVGGGVRFVGDLAAAEGPQLGASAALYLPTGSVRDLTGDGSVGFGTRLSFAFANTVVVPIANLGVRFRPESTFLGVTYGHELTYALGVRVPVSVATIEVAWQGAATLVGAQAFTSVTSPMTLSGGGDVQLGLLHAGLGLSVGLTDAMGVADVGVVARIGVAAFVRPTASGDGEDDEAALDTSDEADPSRGSDDDPDGDGILAGDDFCPDEPETINDVLDDDGCPDGATRDGSLIVVTPAVLFDHNETTLVPASEDALRLIATLLREDTSIALVQLEGHASDDEEEPLDLGEQRADTVMRWLVDAGIERSRLTAVGIGADQPATDSAEENRRVELRVLDL